MNRPLPDEYLDYASQDAYLIYSLYDYFSRVGYFDLVTAEQSMRYVSLYRHFPPHRDDIYASHPLLPLGILGEDPIYGLTKKCLACNRTLSLFGFPPFEVGSRCFVCRAVDVRCQSKRRTMMETKAARVEQVAQICDHRASTPVKARWGALPVRGGACDGEPICAHYGIADATCALRAVGQLIRNRPVEPCD